ncbi:helix-turn-helix transcriptional regulator [Micromonospora sp. BRA006-A]|uniref:helix-turn-helix transcriptional regulator n=1 Tax=Micromonospora sp. BRA006-A TaxID=2962860 RepID=UPI00296EC68E|nr:helix-turn-helix transcriptional regulator [Micromonospora sp. BRA006-A]MDW3845665.1 helix-turn-helix transcriptional regulator [Micromonospora sp. BRA006-A]
MAEGVKAVRVVLLASLQELSADADADPTGMTPLVVDERMATVLAGGAALTRVDRRHRPAWYELLTRIALAADDVSAARDWAHRAQEARRTVPTPRAEGFALLAAAQVALRLGRAAESERQAWAAAGLLQNDGFEHDAVRARRLATSADRVLAVGGRREDVVSPARAAERRPLPKQRRVGQRSGVGEPGTLTDLSGRERQVADLVARGSTNKAIAEELFLSVKTVERHLSRIFDKLGLHSRAALAAMVGREDGHPARTDRT